MARLSIRKRLSVIELCNVTYAVQSPYSPIPPPRLHRNANPARRHQSTASTTFYGNPSRADTPRQGHSERSSPGVCTAVREAVPWRLVIQTRSGGWDRAKSIGGGVAGGAGFLGMRLLSFCSSGSMLFAVRTPERTESVIVIVEDGTAMPCEYVRIPS